MLHFIQICIPETGDEMSNHEKLDVFKGRAFNQIFTRFADQPRLNSIPVLEPPSVAEFHDEIFPAHYPIVFQDRANRLTQADLVSVLGDCDEQIKVRVGDYSDPERSGEFQYEFMPLKDYVDRYFLTSSSDSPPYAGNVSLGDDALAKLGCSPPTYYASDAYEAATVWLGAAGCLTRLHKDGSKNFALHRFGKKRWTLFPPRDAKSLYLRRVAGHSDFAASAIDLRNVDHARFPLFQNAESVSVTVEAGQVLYLPEGWFHYVENLEPSLMVNYWSKNPEQPQ